MEEKISGLTQSNTIDDKIYHKLARYLDDLPAGYPATKTGIEIKILKRFFLPDEAALALHVSLIPEDARVIAHRAKIKIPETEKRLTEMAKKGLLYSMVKQGHTTKYMINQMVIGIWEYHVNDLDSELIKDMNDYIPALFQEAWKVPQLRTIPVNQSITSQTEVTTYELAEELLNQHKKFVVAPCICRREKKMVGEGCNAPEEACLVFGSAADYYLRNDLGREIDKEEAANILKMADEAGLVLQPSNSRQAVNICCCCGCCCAVLRTLKKHPEPAIMVSSPFFARSDQENCDGCSLCLDRCPMDAITLVDGISVVNKSRCIGCGLCVTSCPTAALSLIRKPEEDQPVVPETNIDKYIKLGRERGKLGAGKLVMMQIKSKIDRLIAAKKH